MSHSCPNCGMCCHCSGDIEDHDTGEEYTMRCTCCDDSTKDEDDDGPEQGNWADRETHYEILDRHLGVNPVPMSFEPNPLLARVRELEQENDLLRAETVALNGMLSAAVQALEALMKAKASHNWRLNADEPQIFDQAREAISKASGYDDLIFVTHEAAKRFAESRSMQFIPPTP